MSKQTKTALDPVEIEQLISVYHSELRQLNYRVLSVRKNIEQLQTALSKQSTTKRQSPVSAPAVVATKSVAPAIAAPELAPAPISSSSSSTTGRKAPKKVNMPSPVQVRRVRKLSPWDEFIMNTLLTKDKVLIMSEFLDIVKSDFDGAKGWTEAKIKSKLNAVFHKLANKKGNIVKISFEGRGFAYALPKWLNPAGELKKKYRR
ncbi:MAG: hypothetical protein KTR30_31800 [Saprospiraceae bacterium]|nr:hypothetical protein [Saprospiraceae bacterium]